MNHSHAQKNHWSNEEIQTLIDYYPQIKSITAIMDRLPNRSISAIKLKASSLNLLSNHFKYFTKEELTKLYITDQLSSHQIAQIAGVTDTAILHQLHKFGITVPSPDQKIHRIRGQQPQRWKQRLKEKEYIMLHLQQCDPFYDMAEKRGYIFEHRLIMAKYLGRLLEKWEIVHHINGIKDDNRIENLELHPSNLSHRSVTLMQQEIKELKTQVKLLQIEVKNLTDRINNDNVPSHHIEGIFKQ